MPCRSRLGRLEMAIVRHGEREWGTGALMGAVQPLDYQEFNPISVVIPIQLDTIQLPIESHWGLRKASLTFQKCYPLVLLLPLTSSNPAPYWSIIVLSLSVSSPGKQCKKRSWPNCRLPLNLWGASTTSIHQTLHPWPASFTHPERKFIKEAGIESFSLVHELSHVGDS